MDCYFVVVIFCSQMRGRGRGDSWFAPVHVLISKGQPFHDDHTLILDS